MRSRSACRRAQPWQSCSARRPAARRASAAPCTCSTSSTTSSAGTASWADTSRSRRASPSSSSTQVSPTCASATSARRDQHRRLPRGALAGGHLEAARGVHRGEQRVLDGYPARAHPAGARHHPESLRLRDVQRSLRGQRRVRGARSPKEGRRARAREGAGAHRDPHLSLPRPLDERPRQVPHARGVELRKRRTRWLAAAAARRQEGPGGRARQDRAESKRCATRAVRRTPGASEELLHKLIYAPSPTACSPTPRAHAPVHGNIVEASEPMRSSDIERPCARR